MRTRHYLSIAVCIICLAFIAAPALAVETFTLRPQRAPVQPVIQASPELTPYEVEQREKAIDVLYQERRARYTLAKDPTAGGVLYRSPQTTALADVPAAPGMMRAPGDFTFFRTTTMTDASSDPSPRNPFWSRSAWANASCTASRALSTLPVTDASITWNAP